MTDRMIYYGGCDVKWSPYKISNNTLLGINEMKATKNTCLNPNSDSEVLNPFFSSIKYINYDVLEGIPYITFYDANYNHVSTFTTTPPPVYPSTWP